MASGAPSPEIPETNEQTSRVNIGNVEGAIHGSNIAGRDIIDIGIQIVQQTGSQIPQARNLPAQLNVLQEALPDLDSANRAATKAAIARLEQTIAALPAHEGVYRERVRARYAEDAPYYILLAGETIEATPLPSEPKALRSVRRRRLRAAAEYYEWIQTEKEIQRVKLHTLEEGVAKYPCIILLGAPGSGKTTALENWAYRFADEPDKLPLPLRLSEFRPGMTLEDFILQGWAGSLDAGHWGAPELASNLEGYLEAGKLFLLFDALNEMPREGYHEHARALRRFIDEWSTRGNHFLVTCRVLDYGEELSGLQRVEILPLNDDQIQAFLRNELADEWMALWRRLTEGEDDKRRLLDLARNPYLLTMMIDVYAEEGELRGSRAELLEHFTQILMRWARGKYTPDVWLEADVQCEALSVLAFEMQARPGSGSAVETGLVKTVMPRQVRTHPNWPPRPAPPDQVLTLAAGASIIEMPVDRSWVRFYHQLLQEYYAAHHLLKRDPGVLADLWRWPWLEEEMPLWVRPKGNRDPLPPPPSTGWEETTILAAGLAAENDDQLIRALIQVNPVLAARCLYEGQAKVDNAIRQIVIEALLSTVADPEVALRVRIAAGEVLGYLGDPRLDKMIVIPAGKFIMGDGESEHGDEKPRHKLSLGAYRLGKYPVTNAEYGQFVQAKGYNEKRWWTEAGWEKIGKQQAEPWYWDDRRFNQPNQPVVGVSWYESVAYCRWLSAESGQVYRLATEAEWEKGARGVDGRQYPWGETFEAKRLNALEGEQIVWATTPVGIYLSGASPFDAFDCAGNVWEWCATRRGKHYPYDTTEDEWSETYLQGEGIRVLRGGSWYFNQYYARCSCRSGYYPSSARRRTFNGFRLVSPI